jgi:hypothetical protein
METSLVISFFQESIYLIIVLGIFLAIALFKGKQTLINVTLGLYFALLLSLEFPYFDYLLGSSSLKTQSIIMLATFVGFTIFSTLLFNHLMPREFQEKSFEGFGKKLLFASGATILVMIFSFHVLPITEFLSPGSPIQFLFAPKEYFFWWLITPITILFFL